MKKISFLIFFGLLTTGLLAQNFYDFKGVGARAAGMAFAFNAVADDATAISWNPAGLTQLKKPELSVIQRLQFEEVIFDDQNDNSLSYTLEGNPYYTLDYISVILPVSLGDRNLVLGVAYQNQINFKFTQNTTFPYSDHEGSSKGTTTVNSASLAGGLQLTDFLSFGASFNYYFSLGNQNQWNYIYRHPDHTFYSDHTEVYSFSGFNVIGGLFVDLGSFNVPLKLAARVNTPLKLKNDFSILMDYHGQYTDNDIYRVITKQGSETFNIPLIIGTGASYRFGDWLTLAMDYDLKPFKDAERNASYREYNDFNYTPPRDEMVDSTDLLVQSNDNLNQFRVGLEYIFHPEAALIPVRVGWKNNPTNLANLDINGLPKEQVFATSFNAGLGLIAKNFSVDLAYEYYKYNREGVSTFQQDHTLHSFILSLIIYIRR
jgi:long-subunit fatty acid transport protein